MKEAQEKKLQVIKKDGRLVDWEGDKVRVAIKKAILDTSGAHISELDIDKIVEKAEFYFRDKSPVAVNDIHEFVMEMLYDVNHEVYTSYKSYRQYKKNPKVALLKNYENVKRIIDEGDKENANKNSNTNSTKHALIAEESEKTINKTFELNPKWIELHEQGYIHIHDLGSRLIRQHNCTIFDLDSVMTGGFELEGVQYSEPGGVQKAMDVASAIILVASSNQYGGFTVSNIDTIFSKYAEKTYNKHYNYFLKETQDYIVDLGTRKEFAGKRAHSLTMREIEQGWQGFETQLNTVSNALGQIPFVTVSFGLDTSFWGRKITETALKFRIKGLGTNHVTSVFPKMIFLHRKEINGDKTSPNYDLKKLAVKCSTTRLYPDWLSGDYGYQKEVFDETGTMISPMGCRSFVDKLYNPRTGKLITNGRGNIGVVTINLPMLAIEASKQYERREDKKACMYGMIKKLLDVIYDIHMDAYDRIGKAKGSSNPLLYCEGGAWTSVGYDEEVKVITDSWTASIGFIGLEEVTQALFGKSLEDEKEFGLDLVKFMESEVLSKKKETGKSFSLYATPAESLIERFQNINRERFGVIPNVTNREYMTNSFHQGVWKELYPYEKIDLEADMFHHSLGGRISYCEWEYGVEPDILEQSLDYAMKKGLYWGVNVESATCNDCGHRGEFTVCPSCGSSDVTSVNRTCGYLSYSKVKGDSRYNKGKQAEIRDRVDHHTVEK